MQCLYIQTYVSNLGIKYIFLNANGDSSVILQKDLFLAIWYAFKVI